MKTILILILSAFTASAQIPEPQAVRAEVVERHVGGFFRAQVLIGAVLRQRGSLDGVYGVTNAVIATADQSQRATALRAWRASRRVRTRARYFGCIRDENYFRSIGLRKCGQVGSIVFFK